MRIRSLMLPASLLTLLPVSAQIRERAPSGIRITYKCADKGRYTAQYNNGQRHYCFDGQHYTDATLPGEARQVFDDMDAQMAEVEAKFPSESRSPSPAPRRGGAGVAVSNRPPARAVPLVDVKSIQPGQPASEVVAKLGQPGGRLTGLADGEERWSYPLQSGGTARLRVKDDKVLSIQLP